MHRFTRLSMALILLCAVLAGCAGDVAFKKGEQYAVEGDLDRAVAYYRDALRHDPGNITFKTRLTRIQQEAAIRHMDRATYYLMQNNPDAAIFEAQQANIYDPGSAKAHQLIEEAGKLKKIQEYIADGRSYLAAGRPSEAVNEFYRVLDIEPKNKIAKKYIEEITKRKVQENEEDELTLASNEPITLSFKDAKLKEVFEFLSKISGISILFDEDVKNQPVTVFAKDVSFKEALNLLLATNRLFMKKIAPDAIIIIPKTKAKEDQYQDLKIKTFYLSHIQAKDMVNILRTMLETRRIIINDTLNSITLRETPKKLKLAERLIEANDRQDSEVIINCDVMSVDRGPNETRYGISWPTSVTGTWAPGGVGVIPSPLSSLSLSTGASGSMPNPVSSTTTFTTNWKSLVTGRANTNAIFSYPAVTANFSEAFAKAETLTNPQIRALNNQPAKILIGQRIPVQTGTAVAGAITTSTFEYRDIGIKLTVVPNIGIGGDVKLKVTLEVSSLGGELTVGGQSEPEFNTTTAETTLSLRDGETVIIGGLMDNSTSLSNTGVAGLMDIPILGKLFSDNVVGPNSKRELVMTLTPHIIRPLQLPSERDTSFWSGTEQAYDTKPLFEEKKAKLSIPEAAPAPESEVSQAPTPAAPAGPAAGSKPGQPPTPVAPTGPPAGSMPGQPQTPAKPGAPVTPGTSAKPGAKTIPANKPVATPPQSVPAFHKIGRVGTLSFSPEVTPVGVGQTVTIDVMATNLDSTFEAPLSIIYNPKLVKFVKATEGNYMNVDKQPTSFMSSANEKIGLINVMLTRLGRIPGIAGSGNLFSLTFKGIAPGISPLVFKQNDLKDAQGVPVPADLKTGTLYVR